jgi:uncharacterized protein HemX
MRGLAMTTEPETGSVTMLRKPGTPQTEPAATTAPAATPQATPTTAPLPAPGNTATRSKALRAGLMLVAATGIGASVAYVALSRSPAPHAPLHAQMAGTIGAAVNSSGITPTRSRHASSVTRKADDSASSERTDGGTDKHRQAARPGVNPRSHSHRRLWMHPRRQLLKRRCLALRQTSQHPPPQPPLKISFSWK